MYRTKHPRRCTRVYFNTDTFHIQRERVRERESIYETYNLFLYFTVSSSVDARNAATATSGAGGGGGDDTFVMPYILIWCLWSLFMIVSS